MADREIKTKLILEGDPGGVIGAMNKVDSALLGTRKNTDLLKEAGQQLGGIFAGIGIVALTKQVVDAGLQLDRLARLFNAATGSVDLAAREMEFARQIAEKYGLSLLATAESYGQFIAATRNTTMEGEKGRRVFESVSAAATALGLSVDNTKGIFNALQQMISKGRVQTEELRGQLGERLPGAFKLAADAMGVSTAELDKMLQQGKVAADVLLPKLADQLDKTYGKAATEGARSAQAEFNRLNNAMFDLKGTAGAALIPVFTDVAKAIKPALELLKEMIGGVEILAVKAASIPDRIRAAEQLARSKNGFFSEDGLKEYNATIARITADQNAVIDESMKRFTATGADYNAAELARQRSIQPTAPAGTAKTKDDTSAWQSAHEKYLSYLESANARQITMSKGVVAETQYANEQGYASGMVSLVRYLETKHKAVEDELENERIAALKNLDQRQQDLAAKAAAADKKGDAKSAAEYHDALKQVEDADRKLIEVEANLRLQRRKNADETNRETLNEAINKAASASHWRAVYDKEAADEEQAVFDHQQSMNGIVVEMMASRLEFENKPMQAMQARYVFERQQIMEQSNWRLQNVIMEESEKQRLIEDTAIKVSQLDQRAAQEKIRLNQQENQIRRAAFGTAAQDMLSFYNLTGKKHKEAFIAYKAFAITETIISTFEGAQKAYTSLASIPIVGPALGIAAAAAAIAAGTARVSSIASSNPGDSSVSDGGAAGSLTAAGGAYNPVVTQPVTAAAATPTQEITIRLVGAVTDAYVENSLIPMLNDAGRRNIKIEYASK